MSTLLDRPASTTPVFSDDSGRRARVLTWLARAVCGCFLLVAAAVAFTLLTRVPLPGLGGLLPQGPGHAQPRTAPKHVGDGGMDTARSFLPSTSATTTGARTAPAAVTVKPHSSAAASSSATVARPRSTPTVAASSPSSQAGGQASGQAGTPSGNANTHATTKTRNPQAPAKKPSPRVVNDPNEHAATGRGRANLTDDSATPPGLSK